MSDFQDMETDVAILPFRRRNPIEAVKPSSLDSPPSGSSCRQPQATERKEQLHAEAFNRFRSIIEEPEDETVLHSDHPGEPLYRSAEFSAKHPSLRFIYITKGFLLSPIENDMTDRAKTALLAQIEEILTLRIDWDKLTTAWQDHSAVRFGNRDYHCLYIPIIGCRYAGPGGDAVTKVTRQLTPTAEELSHASVTLLPTCVTLPNLKLQKRPTQSYLVQFLDPTCLPVQYPEVLTFRNFPPLGSGALLEALKHQVEDYIRFKLQEAKITKEVCLILYPAMVNSFDSEFFGSVYLPMGTSLAVANQIRLAVGLTSPHTADLDFNGYRIMMGPSLGDVLKPQNLAAFSLTNKAPTAMALSGLRPGARLVDLLHALWIDSWYNPQCFENIAFAYIERTAIRHRAPHMFIKGNPSTLPPPGDTLVLITKLNAYARLEFGATLQQYMAEDQFPRLNRLSPAPLPEFTKLLAIHGKLPKDDGSPNRIRPSRPDPKRRTNTPLRRVAADLTQRRAALTAQHHSMRHLIPAGWPPGTTYTISHPRLSQTAWMPRRTKYWGISTTLSEMTVKWRAWHNWKLSTCCISPYPTYCIALPPYIRLQGQFPCHSLQSTNRNFLPSLVPTTLLPPAPPSKILNQRRSSTTYRNTRRGGGIIPHPYEPHPTRDLDIAEATKAYCIGYTWVPSIGEAPPSLARAPDTTPLRIQPHRVVKLPPIVQVPLRPSSLPADIIPISYYPGQQQHHQLGRGCSSRAGAGQGIFALTDMPLNDFAPQHKYNIVCQYGGKRIPLSTAEHPNYPSDYLWGWPEHDEAIDGQLDTTGSIGPLINDDFTRPDSSLEAWRDGKTGRTFLCQIEDISAGEELSLSYGKDFWLGHFLQLSAEAREQCIWKYSISPDELALLGLLPNGMPIAPILRNTRRPAALEPCQDIITIPADLLRRPWAVEVGNLRLWLHTGRRQGDLLVNRNTAIDDLCASLRQTALRLGCAIRIPNLPAQICRPDGSCGAQIAVILTDAGATPLLPLSNSWYFQTEDRHQRYISQLQEWSCNTSTPGHTKVKIDAMLTWILTNPTYRTRLPQMLDQEFWFDSRDVLLLLPPTAKVTLWIQPGTHPDWRNWVAYNGTSESGEENATTWDCLTTYLSTDRSNSILAHSHFHPWSTSEELASTLWEALPLLAAKILAELNNPPSIPADENGTVFLEISSNRTVPIIQSPRCTSHTNIIDQSAPLQYWSLVPTMPHANIKKKNQKKKKTYDMREQQTLDSCWKIDSLLNAPTTQSAVNTDNATRLSCNIGPHSSPVIWMDLTIPTKDPDLTRSTSPSLALLATFAPDLLLDDFPPIPLNPLAHPFLPHAYAHPTLVAPPPSLRALTLRPSSTGQSTLITPSTPLHPLPQPNVDPPNLIPSASLRNTPIRRWGSSIKKTSWHRKAPTPIGFTSDRDGAAPPHLFSSGTDWPLPLLALPREELVCALRLASLQSGLHGQNGLAAHLAHKVLTAIPAHQTTASLLLAITASFHKDAGSAQQLWHATQVTAAEFWDQKILVCNTQLTSLRSQALGQDYSPELLLTSLTGPLPTATLSLSALALSLQGGITILSETGKQLGRYAPATTLHRLRHLPALTIIHSSAGFHGTIKSPSTDTTTLGALTPYTVRQPGSTNPPYWTSSSNLPTHFLDGVEVGVCTTADLLIATLNVNGLTGHKFGEILNLMEARHIGVMVLQDTRCEKAEAAIFAERLRAALGDQSKLFNIQAPRLAGTNGKTHRVKVGGLMFLTNHKWGVYTHDFSPDPTGLGVVSSITVSSKQGGVGIKIIGTYWPPPTKHLKGSLWTRLQASPAYLQAQSTTHDPLTPLQYIQLNIDKISNAYCSKPHHLAVLAGDLNSGWDTTLTEGAGSNGSCREWATATAWKHPGDSLGYGDLATHWHSHFSWDGKKGTGCLDHILTKGSAPITPSYHAIDHSGYWLTSTDHRPVFLSLSSPCFELMNSPTSSNIGYLQFPQHYVKPDFYSVSNYYHTMLETRTPDLGPQASLEEIQAAYTLIMATARKALPPKTKKQKATRRAYKDGWSPLAAALKAQLMMTYEIQRRITPGAGRKWRTAEQRHSGIHDATHHWENIVRRMDWPTVNNLPQIDPRVWQMGTTAQEWRTLDVSHSQRLLQKCILDIRALKKALHGRKRKDMTMEISFHIRARETRRLTGRIKRNVDAILGKDRQPPPITAIPFTHPQTGEPGWHPSSPEELDTVLRDHFHRQFADQNEHQHTTAPTADNPSKPSWESVQSWPSFQAACSHHNVPAANGPQPSVLRRLWETLTNVPNRSKVEAELLALNQHTPTFEDFNACLAMKTKNTTGGISGITYNTVKQWPDNWRKITYDCMAGFWRHQSLAEEWKWRWLVPIPKKGGTSLQDLRPIMLLEVLRKVWTTLIMSRITKVLYKHKVLTPTQHAYLPHKGTDSANLQVINTLETAFEERRALYGSSWDITHAFDTAGSWLTRLSWRRVGIPADLAEWLVRLDAGSHTVVRTEHAFAQWILHGPKGLAGLDFEPERGIGQGDVSSPLTWLAIYDILLAMLHSDDPHGGFRLWDPHKRKHYAAPDVGYADDLQSFAATLAQLQRKADVVSCFSIWADLTIAEHKLRLFYVPGCEQDLSGTPPPGLIIHSAGWVPNWVHFKDANCFKSLGVWYDTDNTLGGTHLDKISQELRTTVARIHTVKASAETIAEVLRVALIAKVAYPGVLSSWSLEESRLLDKQFAKVYRTISKNMATSQEENIFQPREAGGLGFPRISHIIQDRKISLLERIAEHGDQYTKLAVAALKSRGSTVTPTGGQLLNRIRPGYWISSVVAYLAEGDIEYRIGDAATTSCPIPQDDVFRDPVWRNDLMMHQQKYLKYEHITSQQDLMELSHHTGEPVWREHLPLWLRTALPLQPPYIPDQIALAIGQFWHIAHGTHSRTISIKGLMHSDDGTPLVELHSWFMEALLPRAEMRITLPQKACPHLIPYAELFDHMHDILHLHMHTTGFQKKGPKSLKVLRVTRTEPPLYHPKDAVPEVITEPPPSPCPTPDIMVAPPTYGQLSPLLSLLTDAVPPPPPDLSPPVRAIAEPPSLLEPMLLETPSPRQSTQTPDITPALKFYVGHHHAPSLILRELNNHSSPLCGGYSCLSNFEWALTRFTDTPNMEPPHPSTYSTFLLGLTLHCITNATAPDQRTEICLPHPSLLRRILGSSKTPVKIPTQISLLRAIRSKLHPGITFSAYKAVPRVAFNPNWAIPQTASYWVSLWHSLNADHLEPGRLTDLPLSALIPEECQLTTWLPYHIPTGAISLGPAHSAVNAARHLDARTLRDHSRATRNAPPYWNDNTFPLAARVLCLPEATVSQAGHREKFLGRRHWGVRSNRTKHLAPGSTEWREAGHCPLCLLHTDSYDHWIRDCPEPNMLRVRQTHLDAIHSTYLSTLPPEQSICHALTLLFARPDGYRICLGDLNTLQREVLLPQYLALRDTVPDRDADSTLLKHIRSYMNMMEALWEERVHTLDPAAPSWAPQCVKGSKFFAVFIGHAPGVYADYALAKSQIHHYPGNKWKGFPTELEATAAHTSWTALLAIRLNSTNAAEGTDRVRLYVKGSYKDMDRLNPALPLPPTAGWGMAVFGTDWSTPLHSGSGPVALDPVLPDFHGATETSLTTAALTGLGEALAWIGAQPSSPKTSYELCTDNQYGLALVDALTDTDQTLVRNGALIAWSLRQLQNARNTGHTVLFRKVQAAGNADSLDTSALSSASALAHAGRLAALDTWLHTDRPPDLPPPPQTPLDHETAIRARTTPYTRGPLPPRPAEPTFCDLPRMETAESIPDPPSPLSDLHTPPARVPPVKRVRPANTQRSWLTPVRDLLAPPTPTDSPDTKRGPLRKPTSPCSKLRTCSAFPLATRRRHSLLTRPCRRVLQPMDSASTPPYVALPQLQTGLRTSNATLRLRGGTRPPKRTHAETRALENLEITQMMPLASYWHRQKRVKSDQAPCWTLEDLHPLEAEEVEERDWALMEVEEAARPPLAPWSRLIAAAKVLPQDILGD